MESAVRVQELGAPIANIKALNYRNQRVTERLVSEHGMEKEEADILFEDTLRFLSLTDNGIKLAPSARIDLGWHNFILHTREYADFCQSCFGRFIHHEPGSGLTHAGPKLTVAQTAAFALKAFGELSPNWDNANRDETCGSNGC